jgi:hypothetical protein
LEELETPRLVASCLVEAGCEHDGHTVSVVGSGDVDCRYLLGVLDVIGSTVLCALRHTELSLVDLVAIDVGPELVVLP